MQKPIRQEIIDNFKKNITPKLISFENERLKILFEFLLKEIGLIILFCSAVYFSINCRSLLCRFLMNFTGILSLLFIPIFPFNRSKSFKNKLKSELLPEVLDDLKLANIYHSWLCNIKKFSEEELKQSGLFPYVHYSIVDDSFAGNYLGVHFKIEESALMANRCICFEGAIICFNFNKQVRAKTRVLPNRRIISKKTPVWSLLCGHILAIIFAAILYELIAFPIAQQYFDNFSIGFMCANIPYFLFVLPLCIFWLLQEKKRIKQIISSLDTEIKLEDAKFAKKFTVYSEDEIEARYLITPAFMERLLNLQTSFGAKQIRCAFYDDKILFAIPTKKDLFELGSLYKSLLDFKNMGFFNELTSILEMIEYFKLNEKTGL